MSIAISGALLKYFGASSTTSSAAHASSGMVSSLSTLQDELPSMSSATDMSPQISEDEEIFACVCVCVEGVCLGYKTTAI